ncbi:hypothetical protein [Inquilinus sp.]|jgi:hypothetical protein|uniref:hypothetical protein n=1 Tax=Inquilinus sp. TaxID=1932117 RepID=UPI0037844F1C
MSGNTTTLVEILRGLVGLLESGVANLVLMGSAAIGVALCLFAAWQLYSSASEDRSFGQHGHTSPGAILAFVFGALLTIVSIVAARLSTLYAGT